MIANRLRLFQGAIDPGFVLSCAKGVRVKPQLSGRSHRIDAEPLPPDGLIAAAVGLAMVPAFGAPAFSRAAPGAYVPRRLPPELGTMHNA